MPAYSRLYPVSNGGIDEDINIIQGNIMAGRRRSDVWAVLVHQSV